MLPVFRPVVCNFLKVFFSPSQSSQTKVLFADVTLFRLLYEVALKKKNQFTSSICYYVCTAAEMLPWTKAAQKRRTSQPEKSKIEKK